MNDLKCTETLKRINTGYSLQKEVNVSRKKALLCGINYPNTSHSLNGCVNDVLLMQNILTEHFNFELNEITLLIDAAATTTNILIELDNLVKDAQPGDILYFHYSGHGSQMVDDSDPDHEPDGLDEIICPIDLDWQENVVRDDDLKRIFDKVPSGVNLTVMLDCCNSGGGLDHLNQYQYDMVNGKQIVPKDQGRYLPPPNPQAMLLLEKNLGFKERTLQHRDVNQTSLLISGCRSHQTSADAFINGKYQGAATYAVCSILDQYNYDISYRDLIERVNKWVYDYGFTQRPELNGPEVLFEKKFLSHYITESVDDSQEVDPRPVKPKPTCRKCKRVRRKCKCSRRWKQWYWRLGIWRYDYWRDLRKWRRALREWKRKHS